jgi:superfamily II DNA or RNA helicase
MINLRPYQHESIKELREGFKSARRQVLCLPTGAGKTVVFSEMARLAASKETQTLVLTDRLELFDQTFKSLSRVGIICQRIEAKGNKRFDTRAIVSVGMVETVKRRFAKGIMEGFEPKLIVIDEAHKGNFNAILEAWPNAMVIGATATPVGKHFYKYYSSIVQNIDIPELIEQGFLMPCKPYQMQDDLSDLKTVAGEYTDDSLYNHFNSQRLFDGVISEWQKLAKGKKTLVFNVNIQHANNMTKAFNDAGIFSECVTSETSKEDRARILRAFSMGLIPVLNNCGILTTGYDEPSIECIIMNRATKSLPLWLQCCGRGSRLCDEIGKEQFIVLDFGLNHNEHGMWSEARKWQIAPPKKKKKMDAAPVKECPKCNALVFASARTCRYCEHVFPFEAKELSQGSMVEIGAHVPVQLEGRRISSLDVDELIILEHSKAYKASFIWRVIRSKGKETIREYAAKKKHSSGWAWRQEKDIDNSSFKDYILK